MCAIVALVTIAYFYVRVYLGIRKRKTSEISQVTALVKAKLESKIAKTTFLLTAAAIFSTVPAIVVYIIGEAFPVFRKSVSFRLWELPINLNSLVNPLLYCYRDRRFRNALLELLRIKKPRSTQPSVGSVRYVRRNDQLGSVNDALELKDISEHTRLIRTVSCELAVVSDCVYGSPYKITLKRSMSAPTLKEYCGLSSLDDFEVRQPSSIILTTATVHFETNQRDKMKKTIPKFSKDVNLSRGAANGFRNTSRSQSFHAGTSVIAKSCLDIEDKILKTHVRRKDPFAVVEDVLDRQQVAKHTRLISTVSCDLAVVPDCVHGRPNEIMLKRSMSAPTLKECYNASSLDELELRQHSSVTVTTATIHIQTGQRDKMKKTIPELSKSVKLSQGTANRVRNTSRSQSFHAGTYVNAKSCPDIKDKILKRPRTAP